MSLIGREISVRYMTRTYIGLIYVSAKGWRYGKTQVSSVT